MRNLNSNELEHVYGGNKPKHYKHQPKGKSRSYSHSKNKSMSKGKSYSHSKGHGY